MELGFCGETIEISAYYAYNDQFRHTVALLEVLGLPYLESLKRQNIHLAHSNQIRDVLEKVEKKEKNG